MSPDGSAPPSACGEQVGTLHAPPAAQSLTQPRSLNIAEASLSPIGSLSREWTGPSGAVGSPRSIASAIPVFAVRFVATACAILIALMSAPDE